MKLLFALYGEQKHSSVSLKYLQIPIIVLGLCQRYTYASQTKIHQFKFFLANLLLLFYEVKTYFREFRVYKKKVKDLRAPNGISPPFQNVCLVHGH